MEYLTVTAADACYAIPLAEIRRIVPFDVCAPLPGFPDYVRGAMALRGRSLPVIDLGRRLGGAVTPATPRTHVLVLGEGEQRVGALVAAVGYLAQLQREEGGDGDFQAFVSGAAPWNGSRVWLLDTRQALFPSAPA